MSEKKSLNGAAPHSNAAVAGDLLATLKALRETSAKTREALRGGSTGKG